MSSNYSHWTQRPGDLLRSGLWTTLFCLAIAVLLWVVNTAESFKESVVISLTIGWSILSVHMLAGAKLEPALGLLLTNVVATALGLALATGLLGIYVWLTPLKIEALNWTTAGPALFFGAIGTIIFTSMAREHQMREELSKAELAKLATERALTEAKLKTLQAQIEPHFLFNTLTTAMGLIHTNPQVAEETLQQLTKLLRNSLSRTRTDQAALSEELSLIDAYLQISKIRMGERLQFNIQCDEQIKTISLPPMLVQPLVENAITHGLEPCENGGHISVSARRADQGLRITVTDTGLGLTSDTAPSGTEARSSTSGTNTGLRNIRDRLQQLYGPASSLRLTANEPRGVIATLFIPDGQDQRES